MNRKDEHIHYALQLYQSEKNDFDDVQLIHNSLPQVDQHHINLQTSALGTIFEQPFFINAMTGGSQRASEINEQLAYIAQRCHLAIATGSQSIALTDHQAQHSFKILRTTAPKAFIMANLGAGKSVEDAKRAVDMIEANALQLHINAAQEIVMPEGDREYSHWLTNIEKIVQHSEVPVIVKEVGFGMSRPTVERLMSVGVQHIDISGRGGTNFANIEDLRATEPRYDYFYQWGLSTCQSLLYQQNMTKPQTLIASGGIRQPLDIIKSLVLGADMVGVAGHILHYLTYHGVDKTVHYLQNWHQQLIAIMAVLGVSEVTQLSSVDYLLFDRLLATQQQIDDKKEKNLCLE